MSNYSSIKSTINSNIKRNGSQAISGTTLNSVLIAMVNALGAGYQFAGIATTNTNPGTPDYNVAYLAAPGTYPNMGNQTIPSGSIGILMYNGSWLSQSIAISGGGGGGYTLPIASASNLGGIKVGNGLLIDANGVLSATGGGGGGGDSSIIDVNEDGFFVVDNSLYIGFQVTQNGILSKNVLPFELDS